MSAGKTGLVAAALAMSADATLGAGPPRRYYDPERDPRERNSGKAARRRKFGNRTPDGSRAAFIAIGKAHAKRERRKARDRAREGS